MINTQSLLEKHLNAEHAGRAERVRTFSRGLWGAGDRFHPFYTLHGPQHSEQVERIAGEVIGGGNHKSRRVIEDIESEQLFYLICSVWLHDIGMLLPPKTDERRQARDRGVGTDEWIRSHHHERSASYIRANSGNLGLSNAEAAYVGAIAKAHRGAGLRFDKELDDAYPDTRFLAAVLRLADGLDISCNRAPEQLMMAHWEDMDEISRWHWVKHWCVVHIRPRYFSVANEKPSVLHIGYDVGLKLPDRSMREPIWERIIVPIKNVIADEGVDFVLLKKGLAVDCESFRLGVLDHNPALPDGRSLRTWLRGMLAHKPGNGTTPDLEGIRRRNQAVALILRKQVERVFRLAAAEPAAHAAASAATVVFVQSLARARTPERVDAAHDQAFNAFSELLDRLDRVSDTDQLRIACAELTTLGGRLGRYLVGDVSERRRQLLHLAETAPATVKPLLQWAARRDRSTIVRGDCRRALRSLASVARRRRG